MYVTYFAVRMALGAGRGRLIGEWLLESVLLALLGGAIGTGIAYAGVRLLKAIGPETLPRLQEITIDARVLAFAVLVSIVSGSVRTDSGVQVRGTTTLGDACGQPRHQRQPRAPSNAQRPGRRAGGAGARAARERGADDSHVPCAPRRRAGISTRVDVQTIGIAIPTSVAATPDQTAQMHKAMLEALATIPGVTGVALTNAIPMGWAVPSAFGSARMPLVSERDTSEVARNRQLRMFKYVSPDYFRISGTRVIAGREYTWRISTH
jgi:hypothetical protein